MNKGYNLFIIHCKNEGSLTTGNITVVKNCHNFVLCDDDS